MIIEKLEKCAETVTEKLDKYLDLKDTDYKNLTDSMRYSVLSGGKRVRPYLAYAFARTIVRFFVVYFSYLPVHFFKIILHLSTKSR